MRELGVRLFESSRNHKALKMSKGQQELPPSEHHFRWLIYVTILVLAIGGAFLLFVQLSRPTVFSEEYAKELLYRHDASLAQEFFNPNLVEEENGEVRNDRRFTGLVRDNGSFVAIREAIVTVDPEQNNKTILATYTFVGSKPIEIGRSRSWNCPYNTYYNISTEVTDRYYYIGVTSSYLPVLLLLDFLQNRTQTTIIPGFAAEDYQATLGNQDNLNLLIESAKGTDFSQVWYFSPDERIEYEQQLLDLLDATLVCTEVTA